MVDNIHSLCPPAIIYLVFSFTQIIIDMFKGLYNTAFFKFIVMFFFTFLLNVLCKEGLSIISWIIVFIPFMMMSIVTAILLFVFGLNPATGKLHYKDLTRRYKYPDRNPDRPDRNPDWPDRNPDWPGRHPDRPDRNPDWPDRNPDWPDRNPDWSDRNPDWSDRNPDWSDRNPDWSDRNPDWSDRNDDTDDRYNTDINDTNLN